MKYLIMVYGNPSALAYFEGLTDAERREAVRVHAGVHEALTASGELISSASLQGPATGTRVSVRDTGPVVTDGPFAEVKEHLAGFYLVDCAEPRPGGRDRGAGRGDRRRRGRGAAGAGPRRAAGAGGRPPPRVAPQVLTALVRRHGDFDACEDAVQEALLAAATQWPADGVPANPKGWLITVASRRWIERWRAEAARARREERAAREVEAPDPPRRRATTR